MAMVFRWFICDIAMATEAGGSPMGSSGWGIIMKGRSNPERGDERLQKGAFEQISSAEIERVLIRGVRATRGAWTVRTELLLNFT